MLREALEYIVGLGESKQHEINGSIYSDKELYRVDTYFPKALAIELNTLTGLVDYIKSSIDEMPGKMIVDVKDPETVRLYSQLDPNRDRETLVIVRARVPEFYFNRTGIASKGDAIVPNPVKLKPYRTFLEVDQPVSEFIFRMKQDKYDGVLCALFEADGGAWKMEATERIKKYLESELKEYDNFTVIS